MGHMAEKHSNQLRPARKPLRTVLGLMLGYQLRKFGSGEMMKKLTKQAGTFYHLAALSGVCCVNFVGAKIIHHNSPGGYFA
jgi:hypothetical protein